MADYKESCKNSDTPYALPAWNVYFDGNFWGHSKGQRPGTEISVDAHFDWAGHHWVIPAVYSCAKGLVVDFCMKIEPKDILAFLEKWDLSIENEAQKDFTEEQLMQIALENPTQLDFHVTIRINDKVLHSTNSCSESWNPCLPERCMADIEAKQAVEHYSLDPNFGWMIQRACYPWATKRKPKIKTLSVTMAQQKMSIPGPSFRVHAPGDTVSFCYRGADYTLTVREYEAQTLDMGGIARPGFESPSHCYAMRYTLAPQMPAGVMTLADCMEGDNIKRIEPQATLHTAGSAASVGIIGGADGPVAIAYGQPQDNLLTACSSLHFEIPEDPQWRIVFHEKQFEDMTVDIGNFTQIP